MIGTCHCGTKLTGAEPHSDCLAQRTPLTPSFSGMAAKSGSSQLLPEVRSSESSNMTAVTTTQPSGGQAGRADCGMTDTKWASTGYRWPAGQTLECRTDIGVELHVHLFLLLKYQQVPKPILRAAKSQPEQEGRQSSWHRATTTSSRGIILQGVLLGAKDQSRRAQTVAHPAVGARCVHGSETAAGPPPPAAPCLRS